MNKKVSFNDVVEGRNKRLTIDCIYQNNKPYRNTSDLVLPKIMNVKNSGGFRYIGRLKDPFDIKYIVLYSTNQDIYWQDELDEELGMYIYYGDNKQAGRELHDTNIGGNLILKNIFDLTSSKKIDDRIKIPPIFLFEKSVENDVKFSGLLVPGYKGITEKEWLTALWAKRDEGGRFQNYKAIFTVLDISTGSEFEPDVASINLKWLEDLKNGCGYQSKYAPLNWKKWIKHGIYNPLITKVEQKIRKKEDQLPHDEEQLKMLSEIYNYFKDKPTNFEFFATYITMQADKHVVDITNTRPTRDGGRDGIGEYRIMNVLGNSIKTIFAVEAKCYSITDSVGVKETSRLISRIRNRQFGVLVTTSFVAQQAYEEIIEDQHPIAIIAGKDIVDILFKNEITNVEQLKQFLNIIFPKNLNS